jgi:Tfp pilus assembly protein PilN
MKRTNYLVTRSERLVGVALPRTAPARLRGPLAALLGSLALVGALDGVQVTRLASTAHEGRLAADRLAAGEGAVLRVRAVENDVVRLRGLVQRVTEIRRSGPAQAGALAALGNGVPADAWLASIRVEHGGYTVEGRGARLSAVGTTMAALASVPAAGAARLLDVHDRADRSGVSYAISLEKRQ